MKSVRIETYSGRRLCSSRDTFREASRWCEVVLEGEVAPLAHYWVIGLGAGYHIEVLAERRPQAVISVIDCRPELTKSFLKWGQSLKGQVVVEQILKTEELFTGPSFRLYGALLSPVFIFSPALQGIESWAQGLRTDLLGQSVAGFKALAELFSFDLNQDLGYKSSRGLISVKEVDQELVGLETSKEKKLVQLLRELVR